MNRFIFLLLVLFSNLLIAQEDNISSDSVSKAQMLIEGDSIPREFIDLEEVIILEKLHFNSLEERKRYLILRHKTHKVYPYAKLASERLVELGERLKKIESRRDRKRYTKIVQEYIEDQFSAELKKLTHTEGQILVKLIHRQTGVTTFDLIKELKSGWRAFWYNTTASFFDISLKREYHPESDHEDYLIEDILQRAFQANILEEQPTALDFNFLELTDKWSVSQNNRLQRKREI